jgi:rubredoxin
MSDGIINQIFAPQPKHSTLKGVTATKKEKALKPKFERLTKCKVCRYLYKKRSISHKTCGPECALKLVEQEKLKRVQRADRIRKVELKPKREWMKGAQQAFNAYIRKRDENEPCISCGRIEVECTVGGKWDCGHYLTVGAFPELRFDELNAHKQCKSCNAGSSKFARKGHTVAREYRDRLIKKIGIDRVEWLEGPHEPKKYTITGLQSIRKHYQEKLKTIG